MNKIIYKLLTQSVKANIKSVLFSIRRVVRARKKIVTNYPIKEYCSSKTDTFFGYYDVSPFNGSNEILYLELRRKSKSIDVVVDTLDGNKKRIIASSAAWNWQQGCRLRWISNDDISFNDFVEEHYINRTINVRNFKEKDLPWPLYDIDKRNKYGLTLDFERLGKLRPGYGYTCVGSYNDDPTCSSIILVDVTSQRIIKTLSYVEVGKAFNCNIDYGQCYVNHLSFCPDGHLFLFFWIEIIDGYHKALMGVYNIVKDEIIPLETKNKVSHYVWLDNNRILCTVYSTPVNCKYFVYNIIERTKHPYCENSLNLDGHPSVYDSQHILTDTYPDANGYQYLRYVDSQRDCFKNLAEIYSVPVSSGERRTDLHPRFNINKTLISFDANIRGTRSFYILKK